MGIIGLSILGSHLFVNAQRPSDIGDAVPPARKDLAAGPNILLICVDTLRADRLGLYGYARSTTPNIDRWFQDGTIYLRAYAAEAATPASVVSFLSGKLKDYPLPKKEMDKSLKGLEGLPKPPANKSGKW